jgi:pyruvate/2-oxoglutarate dehydrogenase complex dihydrolipoamide dehydrogenase (E3) component
MARRFDAIVIGAGQAGPSVAARLDGAGMRIAIIERARFGGTCVNDGCTTTKTLIASAYAAQLARRAAEYGVRIEGEPSIDMPRVKARKDAIVRTRRGVEQWMEGLQNVSMLRGTPARNTTLSVDGEELSAAQIFLDVGGRPLVPKMPGVDQVPYLTNVSMMDVDFLPQHLLVVGGSYIGLEFGQMYRRFGSRVTIVEMGPRLIGREDGTSRRRCRKSWRRKVWKCG